MRFQKIKNLNKLQYGDILFFKPIKFRSRLICWLESLRNKGFNTYSHVALFWKWEGKTPLFIEADINANISIKSADFRVGNIVAYRPSVPPMDKEELAEVITYKYDTARIIQIIFYYLFHVPIAEDFHERFICSELVNYAYSDTINPEGMCTPATLLKTVLSNLDE